MTGKFIQCVAIPALLAVSPASAGEQTLALSFEVQPGSASTISARFSDGTPDSDNVTFSGTMLAEVVFDDESLEAKNLTFTGGRVASSDTNLFFSAPVFITGLGTFTIEIFSQTRNYAGAFSTPSPPGTVSALGEWNRAEHNLTVNEGTTTRTGTIVCLGSESETVDFSVTPETGPLEGVGSLLIREVSVNSVSRTLEFSLVTSTATTVSEPLEGTTSSLIFTEQGTFTAIATTQIPTALGQWALDHGVTLVSGEERNAAGIPHALLHAFHLEPGDTALPMEIESAPGASPVLEVTLPLAGLNATLIPQMSSTLRGDDWIPLPMEFWLSGPGSLDSGASGTARLRLPGGTSGFVRLQVAP